LARTATKYRNGAHRRDSPSRRSASLVAVELAFASISNVIERLSDASQFAALLRVEGVIRVRQSAHRIITSAKINRISVLTTTIGVAWVRDCYC